MVTEPSPAPSPLRVALISLGCAKNLVDTEIMLGSLLQAGMEITNDAGRAEVVIVNTCSFIEAAQAESVEAILECAALRDARRGQGLIVAGCLPQRFRDELPRLLPEVDAFIGIDQVTGIAETVRRALARRAERLRLHRRGASARARRGRTAARPKAERRPTRDPAHRDDRTAPMSPAPFVNVHQRPTYLPDHATARFRLTPRHFAYVKIAEGCNHPCTFCTIPRIRGRHRSRPQADIVEEARRLLADGVKELNLISQDSTYYGLDLRRREKQVAGAVAAPTLSTLLRELQALPGDFWIRLLYTHPAHWTDALIQTIAACPKVARYADIPLQHIQQVMLQRMRRETSREYLVELLRRIRAGIPGIALRTTFLVGFPGETAQHFEALLAFIRETRFERLGVFTYSPEAGTIAGKMAGQVPDHVKRQRRDQAMAEQQRVARGIAAETVGKTLRVLVEGTAEDQSLQQAPTDRPPYLVARGEADAPDIDGRVYLRGHARVGDFAQARIIGHTDYDLIANLV